MKNEKVIIIEETNHWKFYKKYWLLYDYFMIKYKIKCISLVMNIYSKINKDVYIKEYI